MLPDLPAPVLVALLLVLAPWPFVSGLALLMAISLRRRLGAAATPLLLFGASIALALLVIPAVALLRTFVPELDGVELLGLGTSLVAALVLAPGTLVLAMQLAGQPAGPPSFLPTDEA